MAVLATTQPGAKFITGGAFTITNATADYAMDANAAADAEICDVLAMVITELIKKGILNGTVNS